MDQPVSKFTIRVYALIINGENEVLLSDEFRLGMRMTKFPGGGLQFGEGTLACLKREAMEDIGFDSSNQNLKGAYAKLVMQNHSLNENFLLLDADNSRPLKRIYYPAPKASIDRITITLKKPNGDIIDLGPDSDPDQPPIKDMQNSFTFRIITKITDVAPLGHRNV